MQGLERLSIREATVGNVSIPMGQLFLHQRPWLNLILLPLPKQVLHKVVNRIVAPVIFARQACLVSILAAPSPPFVRVPTLPSPASPMDIPEGEDILDDGADETKPEAYRPDVMFPAMRFSTVLKNPRTLREAVRLSAGLLVASGPASANGLLEDISAGRLRIPEKRPSWRRAGTGWIACRCCGRGISRPSTASSGS